MLRPDPTPPDDTLFPISPCHTAELDARALDAIGTMLRQFLNGRLTSSEALKAIALRVVESGREV